MSRFHSRSGFPAIASSRAGQIIGDSYGMLKLIVHAVDTREILAQPRLAVTPRNWFTSAKRLWAAGEL